MLVGSSEAGPTQAMRWSWERIAALLQTSDPVQSRPMLVSRRTVIAHCLTARRLARRCCRPAEGCRRPARDNCGAPNSGQPLRPFLPNVGLSESTGRSQAGKITPSVIHLADGSREALTYRFSHVIARP